jgi:hypothetical protein
LKGAPIREHAIRSLVADLLADFPEGTLNSAALSG